jgi:hypothetical protein
MEQRVLQKSREYYKGAESITKEQRVLQKSREYYKRAESITKEQRALQKSREYYKRALHCNTLCSFVIFSAPL